MKKIAGATAAVLMTAGLALAQPPVSGQDPGMSSQYPDTDKAKDKDKKEITADVVSVDTQAKTITVKKTEGTATGQPEQMTLSVDASAQSSLSGFSAGDRVKLATKTDSAGTQMVTKITRVDTRPATDQPPSAPEPPRQ